MKYIFLLLCLPQLAFGKLKVGATTEDLASLVKIVAGSEVDFFSIAKGTQDPHQIEAKPSFMIKFRDADLVIAHGLDLESAWLKPLLEGARNPKIMPGTKGLLELGALLDPIEVDKNNTSRASGDVHPDGNPHFQLDPIRMGKAAEIIAKRLGEIDSKNKSAFEERARSWSNEINKRAIEWKKRIDKSGISEFVSYHKTLAYFANRFQLKNSLQLEPKPGIPPTATHILSVLKEMKDKKIKLVLIENYFDDSIKIKLQNEYPEVIVKKIPVAVGGENNIQTTQDLIERIVLAIENKI
jgi:zinc/manganese transport system substrate-binding protein